MKIGNAYCSYCGAGWVALFPEDMQVLPCPFCTGVSEPPTNVRPLTGRCTNCGHPYDDHTWAGDVAEACPQVHAESWESDYPGQDAA
jgi:hypothetical protein